VPTDAHELVHRRQPGHDHLVLDGHVPGELRSVDQDHAVADVAIVREVHVRHDEARLAHRRAIGLGRAAVDVRVLADRRVVADLDPGLLALELEVLRVAAEDRADADLHAAAEPHVALERRACGDHGAVADGAVLADQRPGADLDVLAEHRARVHDRRRDARECRPSPGRSGVSVAG
jgi:hypothetical protein